MITRLLLVRHGHTDWNLEGRYQGRADTPLNGKGREEARLVGERLKSEGVDLIYSSDILRAYETAQIIAGALGKEISTLESLREVDTGAWTGLTWEEVKARFPEHFREWQADPWRVRRLGGEFYAHLYRRSVGAARKVAESHPERCILIVAHGGNIKSIILDALGVEEDRALEVASRMGLDNGSISIVDYGEGGVSLRLLNDTCHLELS